MPQHTWMPLALDLLQSQLGRRLGRVVTQVISGGDINTTFKLTCDQLTLFVKYNALPIATEMFSREAAGTAI